VRALVFDFELARLAAARVLGAVDPRGYLSSLGPVRLAHVLDAQVLGDRWVVVETAMCGVCGSDVKSYV
jgi:hypothetical protein